MNNSEIIYRLTTEDVQNVAMQELEKRLPPKEVKKVAEAIEKTLDWYDAIARAIRESSR